MNIPKTTSGKGSWCPRGAASHPSRYPANELGQCNHGLIQKKRLGKRIKDSNLIDARSMLVGKILNNPSPLSSTSTTPTVSKRRHSIMATLSPMNSGEKAHSHMNDVDGELEKGIDKGTKAMDVGEGQLHRGYVSLTMPSSSARH